MSSSLVAQLITDHNAVVKRILLCSALLNLETCHYNLWHWKILGANIECQKIFQSIQYNLFSDNNTDKWLLIFE